MQINTTNKKLIEELKARGVKNIDRVLNDFLTEILTEMKSLTNGGKTPEAEQINAVGAETLRRQLESEERRERPSDTPLHSS